MPADLLLVNGRVRTMDPANPSVSAVAIRQGRVVFAGDGDRVRVKVEKRAYGFVSAIVPEGAESGRVFVIAADGTRSNTLVLR